MLDILVQARRDEAATAKFLRELLQRLAYVPRVLITDKLASDGAAMRAVLPGVEHRRHKGRDNRAENAHQPTRERERRRRRFRDLGHAQRCLAALEYRQRRAERFATWRAVTGTPALA